MLPFNRPKQPTTKQTVALTGPWAEMSNSIETFDRLLCEGIPFPESHGPCVKQLG